VAVDFFEDSIAAFHHGVLFARDFSAQLIVFHNCGTYGQEVSDYAENYFKKIPLPQLPSLRELAQEEMQNFLAKNAPGDLPVQKEISEGNGVAKQIIATAKKLDADLIIVGTHGKSGLDRLLLGSAAERVLTQSPVPVLVVRSQQIPKTKELYTSYKRVLIGTDFSEHCEFAIRQGLALAKRLNAEVDVVHAIDPHVLLPFRPFADKEVMDEYEAKLTKQAHQNFKDYLEKFTDSKDFLEFHVKKGSPWEVMSQSCKDLSADLLVMGSHGHHRLGNVLLGSTAQRVVQKACCPFLVIK
jgi:nucleotide-binding universal stress UspA family protein